ncbi:Olfactomedin-4 [Oryzias melastigma]|uniref:Olfactomedin-4 n=2 Tax=Oryzias melastigma TaxID=30732 RepID=A0A3B3BUU4_ORYME|nr:olfactomedin [Oryzias melastigma]KAF6716446.1 Olfactomedin-4 [Oryzias melastigma]
MLFLLLLLLPGGAQTQRVVGKKEGGSCQCEVNSTWWMFPAGKYEAVEQQVQTCEANVMNLLAQVMVSSESLPDIQAQLNNATARLQPFQYLSQRGLYTALSLRQLGQELSQLEADIGVIHREQNSPQTQKLSKEVEKLQKDVSRIQSTEIVNMKSVKEKVRNLKNNVQSCRTIPKDFTGQSRNCKKGLMKGISEPVTTKISPFGKSYISGSWGKQAKMDGDEQKNSYWVQPLVSSHIYGNTLRIYQNFEDFMSSSRYRDFTFAPSHTHTNSIEGPSAVLYGEALYYHCYRSAEVCRYDLNTNAIKRAKLPGTAEEYNNKFPYCYYDCRSHSDVDVEADETGLWAIYATMGNHGNLVVSRLIWDEDAAVLNVSQTWETRLFKKAVSNAFMACGVLYASRYVNEDQEEVFYAFDTATGKEDNTLALPLQKVAKGMASLSYNPTNKQIYMYSDGYLLAYQALF